MEWFFLQTSSETGEEANEGEETRKRRKRRSIDGTEEQEEADNPIMPFVEVYLNNPGKLLNMRSSHPEVFLGKGILEICSKFTGEHPSRSAISIKLL